MGFRSLVVCGIAAAAVGMFGMVGVWVEDGPVRRGERMLDGAQATRTQEMRRVLLENREEDDGARVAVIQRVLRDAGKRCDSVDAVLFRGGGTWTVRCSPGDDFRVVFDEDGELKFVSTIR